MAPRKRIRTLLQYDLFYVKNLSLALDFRIVVHTGKVMFMGEGAR